MRPITTVEGFYTFYEKVVQGVYSTYNMERFVQPEDVFVHWAFLSPEQKAGVISYFMEKYSTSSDFFPMERLYKVFYSSQPEFIYFSRWIDGSLHPCDYNYLVPSFLTSLPLTRFKMLNYRAVDNLFFVDGDTFSFIDVSYTEFTKMLFFIKQYHQFTDKDSFFDSIWYTVDFYLVLPEIFFFFSILLIFISVIIIPEGNKVNFILTFLWLNFIYLFMFYLNMFCISFDVFYFSITSNFFVYSCKLLIIFFSLIFLGLISAFISKDRHINSYEFIFIYSLIVFSLICLMSVNDFLGLFLSLELQSLSLYVLATYKTTSSYSTEAGIKYFILGAIASGMILFGISLLYGLSGSINFNDLAVFSSFFSLDKMDYPTITFWFDLGGSLVNYPYWWIGPKNYDFGAMLDFYKNMEITYFIGFLFIIIGLFFKLGIVPFHMWLPDIYEGAPLISTALFALIPKIALIFLLIRFTAFHFFFNLDVWFYIFISCGLLSIFIGTFGALLQTKIKRLVAYSAISHMGFILVSLANFTIVNFTIAFIYGLTYIFLNFSFFAILISLRKADGSELKDIRELSSLFKNNKVLAFFFSINLFSIAGIPPLFGFYSKWLVLLSLVNNNLWFSAFIVLILSMVSVYYYIKLIKILFFELNDNFVQFCVPGRLLAYIIVVLGFFNLFFMLFSNLFFTEILTIILTLL